MQQKSLYTPEGRAQLNERINKLTPASARAWGKMNASQMLVHSRFPIDVALGRHQLKSSFIMKLFGGMIKKSFLNEKPVKKNSPTAATFKMTDTPDFQNSKDMLFQAVDDFANLAKSGKLPAKHKCFGNMTSQEWDFMQCKHLDHHLTQFGV